MRSPGRRWPGRWVRSSGGGSRRWLRLGRLRPGAATARACAASRGGRRRTARTCRSCGSPGSRGRRRPRRRRVGGRRRGLPGIGKVRAQKTLTELEISESRRVRGLGSNQKERLFAPQG
ncbi:hypothetical protein [Streptomyces sp. ISL-43]|uniref:hypothetical protein n=1 Tax=Streptomyces sp. ISL-43 TaxID=2819183 RepID=UPI0035A9A278